MKKQKLKKVPLDINADLLKSLDNIAKLAHTDTNTVISVILATEMLKGKLCEKDSTENSTTK